MDTLRNEPVILTGNGGMGPGYAGGYHGGDFLSTILAASLLGGAAGYGKGYYQPALVEASALSTHKELSDTRSDIKEVESEIRETLHTQTLATASEARNFDSRLAAIDKSSVESKYEGIIAAKDAQTALHNKIDRENDASRRQIFEFQVGTDKQFAAIQNQINEKFNEVKIGQLQDEIRDLRRSNDFLQQRDQTASIVKAVLEAIKSTTPTP
jgi:hypothetical protein